MMRCAIESIAAAAFLLVAATAALSHEAHRKQVEKAISPAAEALLAAPSAEEEAAPHEHSNAFPMSVHSEAEAGHGTPETNVPKPLAWLGKFHPALTHFPIALLTSAALAELLLMRSGNVLFEHAVRFAVWVGALGALVAAALGWLFAGFQLADDEWLVTAHRWAGTGTAVLPAGLLRALERTCADGGSRARFRVALFASAGLVGATGFLGGALLYGLDHYAW